MVMLIATILGLLIGDVICVFAWIRILSPSPELLRVMEAPPAMAKVIMAIPTILLIIVQGMGIRAFILGILREPESEVGA